MLFIDEVPSENEDEDKPVGVDGDGDKQEEAEIVNPRDQTSASTISDTEIKNRIRVSALNVNSRINIVMLNEAHIVKVSL